MADKVKTYWYRTHIFYCPNCGHEEIYRERMYTKAPPKYSSKRRIVHEHWDYCGAL